MVNIAKIPSDETVAGYVAAEVRSHMGRRGWSQKRLALALGTTQAAVSRRLTGEVAFDASELALIGDALGVHPGDLFPAPENSEGPRVGGGLKLSSDEVRVVLALRGALLPEVDSNHQPAGFTPRLVESLSGELLEFVPRARRVRPEGQEFAGEVLPFALPFGERESQFAG